MLSRSLARLAMVPPIDINTTCGSLPPALTVSGGTLAGISWAPADAEIRRAITQGIARDGSHLKPPMGVHYYSSLASSDLNALVAYLRTVPAKE